MKPLRRPSIIPATVRTSRRRRHEEGYVLPMVLLVAAAVFILGAIWLKGAQASLEMGSRYLAHETAGTLCESACAVCRANLTQNPAYEGTAGFVKATGGMYQIEIEGSGMIRLTAENAAAPDTAENEVTEPETAVPVVTVKTVTVTGRCGDARVKKRGEAKFEDGRFTDLKFWLTENK